MGLNTFDDAALAEAVRTKGEIGAEKIVVFSIDNRPKVDGELRNALAKGGDELVLIKDPALEDADSFTIAKVLAAAVKQEKSMYCFVEDCLQMEKLSSTSHDFRISRMVECYNYS